MALERKFWITRRSSFESDRTQALLGVRLGNVRVQAELRWPYYRPTPADLAAARDATRFAAGYYRAAEADFERRWEEVRTRVYSTSRG